MRKLRKLWDGSTIGLSGLVLFLVSTVSALAAETDILKEQDRLGVTSTTFLRQGVVNIVNYGLGFLGLIAVLMIVYAGVKLVSSAGSEEAMKSGKKTIGYAIVGIIIIFLSFAIVNWIIPATGGIPSQ
ncbi:hypothetical protein COT40_00440 [Candidatus Peregrinibacteria bacterium CG08_land_8_20_14_0_20_41_10]|nr:MAG: hypothetical protein AUJ78_00650 [Candidatus Peregrinibacteria bacterium CG1_02_41_10]PIS32357.1 MAG: hypothetical protein COT40_00440 [Candidatus Peregrinibacteria bacterium CG08_land_8_20_14_0_20_41_10]